MGDFFESVLETASTENGLTAVLAVGVTGALLLLAGAEFKKSKPKESLEHLKDDSKDDLDPYASKYF